MSVNYSRNWFIKSALQDNDGGGFRETLQGVEDLKLGEVVVVRRHVEELVLESILSIGFGRWVYVSILKP
jgi:hypothetical protein